MELEADDIQLQHIALVVVLVKAISKLKESQVPFVMALLNQLGEFPESAFRKPLALAQEHNDYETFTEDLGFFQISSYGIRESSTGRRCYFHLRASPF